MLFGRGKDKDIQEPRNSRHLSDFGKEHIRGGVYENNRFNSGEQYQDSKVLKRET